MQHHIAPPPIKCGAALSPQSARSGGTAGPDLP